MQEVTVGTQFTFTTCGCQGQFGPKQINADSTYAGTTLEDRVEIVNQYSGIQKFIIPFDGDYSFILTGAASGYVGSSSQGNIGKGGRVGGCLSLKKDDILYIIVGQRPSIVNLSWADGGMSGGGASYVAISDNAGYYSDGIYSPVIEDVVSPLFVAGGAGGPKDNQGTSTGGNGGIRTDRYPNPSDKTLTNIKTEGGKSSGTNQAGADFSANSGNLIISVTDIPNLSGTPTWTRRNALGFIYGGIGGYGYRNCNGGFGGGGGAYDGGGGGGGYCNSYSVATLTNTLPGYGGTSFASSFCYNYTSTSGYNAGAGTVAISLIEKTVIREPEPIPLRYNSNIFRNVYTSTTEQNIFDYEKLD